MGRVYVTVQPLALGMKPEIHDWRVMGLLRESGIKFLEIRLSDPEPRLAPPFRYWHDRTGTLHVEQWDEQS
jgi:hypothetical protein